MRFANRALSVGGLLLAVTGLAACGTSSSLLSAGQATDLKSELSQVSQSLNSQQCQKAANLITIFQSTVEGLNSVDQNLVDNLDQGASHLSQLAAKECPVRSVHHTTTTQTSTTPATTTQTTTTTSTTPTTTTQTSTTPTTPTQTTTTPTTTTGPGSGGVGLSGGGGNGNGNGNGQAKDNGPGTGGAHS